MENRKKVFGRYAIIVLITIFLTLYLNASYRNAREIDNFAEKLSYEQESFSKVEQGTNKSDYIDTVLNSTVGISLVKPSGLEAFDIKLEEEWGIGTGIIVSKYGYILTNQHLAKDVGSKVIVTLQDGTSMQAKILWTEENLDLAIIKISGNNYKAALLGDSDNLKLGDDVIAIGNPLGIEFKGSITKGIISGLDRTIYFDENEQKVFMEGLIQTDASINPGNSGGPLINSQGEVVGINTVKITSAEGIGFAVPINLVKNVVESYENESDFEEAYLGISAYDSKATKYMSGINNFESGIYVVEVYRDGPSFGLLEEGDIITSIDGNIINEINKLREYLYSKKPGDKIYLDIKGKEKISITLARKNE